LDKLQQDVTTCLNINSNNPTAYVNKITKPYEYPPIITLENVRYNYRVGILTFEDVVELHHNWKKQNNYIVMKYPKEVLDTNGNHLYSTQENEYYGFFASKRGNRVHRARIAERFEGLYEVTKTLKDEQLFDTKSRGIKKTNILMFTLTYGQNLCLTCGKHISLKSKSCEYCHSNKTYAIPEGEAWNNQGNDYNKFISGLKQAYGKVSLLRSWERYYNGYPHVHLIAIFHTYKFTVRRHTSKKGSQQWIIDDKNNKKISNLHHSWVQQSGVYSMGGVVYVSKYITKEVFQEPKNLTMVACWIYKKQQYSISKDFTETLKIQFKVENDPRLDSVLHYSNTKPLKKRVGEYIGIKIIPNEGKNFVKLRPPPNLDTTKCENKKQIENLYRYIYTDINGYLEHFSISNDYCDYCNLPDFIENMTKIETEEGLKLQCERCNPKFRKKAYTYHHKGNLPQKVTYEKGNHQEKKTEKKYKKVTTCNKCKKTLQNIDKIYNFKDAEYNKLWCDQCKIIYPKEKQQ
jgi:hypothetical protein